MNKTFIHTNSCLEVFIGESFPSFKKEVYNLYKCFHKQTRGISSRHVDLKAEVSALKGIIFVVAVVVLLLLF